MQRLTQIREMLAERGLSPRRRLGQNFLHDHNVLRALVDASGVGRGDLVFEVGPGTGALTEELLARGCEVVACEIDEGLADLVEDRLGDRITLVRGDCLRRRSLSAAVVDAIGDRPWHLVANLPYQIASPLMLDLLMHAPRCIGQWVTIQYEVAQRLVAPVGDSNRGTLTILAQALGSVEVLSSVPPSCFWPAPKVRSACVVIRPVDHDIEDVDEFAKFVKRLFSARRKQVRTTLGADRIVAGVEATARPATLSVEQFLALWRA